MAGWKIRIQSKKRINPLAFGQGLRPDARDAGREGMQSHGEKMNIRREQNRT
jgi:hypothetical protein